MKYEVRSLRISGTSFRRGAPRVAIHHSFGQWMEGSGLRRGWWCGCRFLSGDGPEADRNCSARFKLIPSVVQGSWIIKQAVGNTPVLLGTKLDTKYFRCASWWHRW